MKHTKTKIKDRFIRIRVTDEELKLMKFNAEKLNTSMSDFVRKFVIFQNPTK
jgi:hypothetical protein